jgi:diguanylate cyclase (GGDEF)-like protein
MNEADVAMYRSKEMKNQSMRTIRFDAAEPDMVDLKGPMDIEAGVNQIQETLITTQQEVPIVTDFQEMSVDQIQEYRNTVQTEIDQMRRIAEVDVVAGPGVYNSRGLENQLGNMVTQMRKLHRARDSLDPDERRVARADRRQRLQYVSIDLGDLKIFNDIFGHAQGDKLINVFAQTAKNVVDEYGAVARYGGDEFAILLQGTPRNATTTLEQIHSALLDVDAFQIPQGALRSELDNLSGDAREKFLRAVRRQIVLQRDQLQQQGRTVDIETLMDDSQLENIPMDILSEWKPVFSSGVASYDASIMGDWSAEAVQKTLSLASDRAQEESKSQMRTTGSFITYTAEELGINKATVRRQEDYAITTAFNRRVTDHFTKLYPSIKRRTDQDLNMFPPTVQHRASLNNIVEQLKQKGVLQDGLDIYADVWTDIHDTGYRGREVDFDDPRFKRTLKMTWQTIGEAVGLKPEAVRQMSDQAYEMFSNYADPQADFVGNLFINKILGHGSIGMAMNTQELMDQGVREKEALGMAMLAAAHHPGFPINFVEDTVLPSMGRELPDTRQSPMLPILLIDMEKDFRTLVMADYIDAKMKNKELTDINRLRELYETGEGQAIIDNVAQATRVPQQELSDLFTVNGKRDTISKIAWRTKIPQQQVAQDLRSRRQASANYLRMKLADYVADNLGIMDRANARMHALLGYGLDRITPANPGTLRRNPNTGVVESQGGEIVDKKYGLVASTNITSYERLNLDTVYTRAVENVEQERNAFINAVEDMKSGLDAQGVALLDELKEGIVSEGDALITKTRYNQQQAVAFVNQHLRNSASIPFSGHLRDIDMDIAIVENIVQQDDFQEEFTPEEQAGASYLLRSLKALRTEQIKKRVDQLRKTVSDLNLSRNLPAETTLSPEEVLQQWTLIGGEEKEVTYVLDTLNTMPMEERLDILLQGLREKAQQEESDIILDRADHLMRVAHYSIEQAQRDGENRRKILEAARRAYSDYVETRKQTTNVGGINLNASLLDLQIKRDGKGIPLPAVKQPIHNMKIDGFLPVIIDIAPIQNVPFFISMNDEGTQTDA